MSCVSRADVCLTVLSVLCMLLGSTCLVESQFFGLLDAALLWRGCL